MHKSKSVSIRKVTKVYNPSSQKQIKAVDSVSLDIMPGEFVTLLGPSGCGKTTLLRMIAGFEAATAGDIYIGDQPVNSLPPDKRDTAMVFQSYALFPHLNVFENIAYGLRIKKLSEQAIKEKVSAILELTGLTGLAGRAPNQLSGGQQQRVALARALVMEPAVLLFDEPLSNLDAKLRIYMRSEIRKIQNKLGITSIYVTHDQAEAMSMSDRIIIMNHGMIEQIGTPTEIYARPVSEFVADFIGTANIMAVKVDSVRPDGSITVRLFTKELQLKTALHLQPGEQVKVVLRPEAVKLSAAGGIPAKVLSSVFMGSFQDYRIDVEGQQLIVVDDNPVYKQVFAAGDPVYLNIDLKALHVVKQ